jgi:hypothetical protein
MKTLVLFVFHEINSRVHNFFDNCIFQDDTIDFIVISNDKSNVFELPEYVKVLKRNNDGYDFGGWSEALLSNQLYLEYDSFIFANSSILGPFMSDHTKKWTDIYLEGLKDNIKLFGSTINTIRDPLKKSHVQSYIFSMKKDTLQLLIDKKIFIKNYTTSMRETICEKEILMSRIVIENGGNIGSLIKLQQGIDYTFSDENRETNNIIYEDDLMFYQFYNVVWNEYDLCFIKGNRIPISGEDVQCTRFQNSQV